MSDNKKHFKTFKEICVKTIKKRKDRNIENICRYGLGILDDYLGGIVENELVIIGAGTGVGKTDLSVNIAIHNAMRGKRVKLFSLEGDIGEVVYRYMQKHINYKLMEKKEKLIKGPDYRLNLRTDIADIERQVYAEIPDEMDNLQIFDKTFIPNKTKLLEMLRDTYPDTDLFVIDHLHYLDFGENENSGISDIIKGIKEMTELMERPVTLVSHLSRKHADKNRLPNSSDLHGSSNIEKNANTIILLTPNTECEYIDTRKDRNFLRGTKIIVTKNRTGMPVPAMFDTTYDLRTKEYSKDQDLNCLSADDENRITIHDKIF